MPRESRRVSDRFLKNGLRFAVGDDVEPETVGPIFRDAAFVRGQEDGTALRADAFDFDQA
ncbi:hypothetical protein D3C83_330790 [compost metagenome]